MGALVINLPSSKDRLKFQKKQLKQLGIAFEILQATSVKDFSLTEIEPLTLGWERPLRAVELACFMSHKKAWEIVKEKKLPTLILEDDALLSKHTAQLLKSFKTQTSCDLVTLEVRSRRKIVAKEETLITETNHKLFELYQDRTGAAAYILWPSGAEKLLLKSLNSPPALADAFISSCYSLSAFQLEPAAAIQLDQCENYKINNPLVTQSSISTQGKPERKRYGLFLCILFKLRRVSAQFRMGLRHLSTLARSKRRNIRLKPQHFN